MIHGRNLTPSETLPMTVADPGGRCRRAPPYGSRFFHFDIQIFRNVAASGVGPPPPTGNPGSATEWKYFNCPFLLFGTAPNSMPPPGAPGVSPAQAQVALARRRRRRPQRSASADALDEADNVPRDFDENAYLAGRVPLISERDYTPAPPPPGTVHKGLLWLKVPRVNVIQRPMNTDLISTSQTTIMHSTEMSHYHITSYDNTHTRTHTRTHTHTELQCSGQIW